MTKPRRSGRSLRIGDLRRVSPERGGNRRLAGDAKAPEEVEPVYETLLRWQQSTEGMQTVEELPGSARQYLDRLSELLQVPVGIISTGPDRNATMILRDPFAH